MAISFCYVRHHRTGSLRHSTSPSACLIPRDDRQLLLRVIASFAFREAWQARFFPVTASPNHVILSEVEGRTLGAAISTMPIIPRSEMSRRRNQATWESR